MTKYVSLEHAIRNAVRDQQYKKTLNEDKEWEKDSAAVKASKDPEFINKMIDKWGHRGGAFLNHPALWPEIKTKTDKKKPVNEDFEFEMARNELRTAIDAAKRLMAQLDGEGELEAWVQSKITKGADYLDTVADYMDSRDTKKLKEETAELNETISIVNSKFKGNSYTTPVHIAPGVTQAAVRSAGHRRAQKQQGSATMQGKEVYEQSTTMPMPTTIPSPIDVLKGVGNVAKRYLPRVVAAGATAAGVGAAPAAAALGATSLYNYATDPENIKKAEAERAGEAQTASEFDKKKAEIAQSTAAMKRQAIDDADVARDAAASKSVPKEIQTPAPAAPAATERKPNPFATIAKASKSEFETTPPIAANTNKSIQIGADSIDGSKAPPIAPPAAGVSPAPAAVAIPGTNAPTAVPAIAAPILAGTAANAASAARIKTKDQAQTQAKAETKVQTQKPSNGKGGRIPKLPIIPLPSLGRGDYKAPDAHSEYHDVPVKTSVSQARGHRKFGSTSVSRFKQFREETGPDNTRRKDSSKELVGRPDSAGVKDPKSVLARNGSIKTKIIDEENKLAGVVKSVVKKKKEEKESGPNPLVDFEPKLNHKYDNET